ncbi:MAG TPA: VOC family protein [Caulobacteraceae bacterium]|jgi:predicted enzyme related to lactoylglutathione lyase
MATGRLNAIVLDVGDLAASTRFYAELVGLALHVGSDNGAPGDRWISGDHRAVSWGGGAFLHFALYEAKGEPTRGAQVGFACDDLAAAHARLVAGGAGVIHPPRAEPWGDTGRYSDPDGNVVALTQSRPS